MMMGYGDAEVDDMFELRLAEAVDGYRESTCFLGAWEVTDDSLDMSDSGGEDSVVYPNKFRKRLSNDDGIVSCDESHHNHKRSRRSKKKGADKTTTIRKKHSSSKKKNTLIVNSVSESSLSDVGGPSRARPKKKKKEPTVAKQEKKFSAADETVGPSRADAEEQHQPSAKSSSTAAAIEVEEQHHQRQASSTVATASSSSSSSECCGIAVQRFPEQAEYRCTLCSEEYMMPTSHNPWWALVRHECPKCHKLQFPSISIGAAANQITFSSLPLPSAAADEDEDDEVDSNEDISTDDDLMFNFHRIKRKEDESGERRLSTNSTPQQPEAKAGVEEPDSAVDFMIEALAESLPSPEKLGIDEDVLEGRERASSSSSSLTNTETATCCPGSSCSSCCSKASSCRNAAEEDAACEPQQALPPPPSMAGFEEELASEDADRLFKLFEHARHCSGKHRSKEHADLCLSTKYVMLHLRDCAGTLPKDDGSDDNVRKCPFSWCCPCKRALIRYLA